MNFLKVSIFFLYMKYITSILLLRKNISFQLRTILAFYFIMRIEVIVIYVKITRNDKLRPVVQSPKKHFQSVSHCTTDMSEIECH